MKKSALIISLILTVVLSVPASAGAKKTFLASGEVVSSSPISSRILIKHGSIKGFSESGETEFVVSSKDMLKDLSHYDLVDFTITDDNGDVQIEKITKTGVGAPEKSGLAIGEAARDVLKATSETAQFVTSPIPPAQGLVKSTVGAVAEGTGEAVQDARGPETKAKF